MDLIVSPQGIGFNPQHDAPAPSLQDGDVVTAKVLAILANGKARLAVAATVIDVVTTTPLEAGATVRLSVKHTPDGVRLQLLDPAQAGAPRAEITTTGAQAPRASPGLTSAATPAIDAHAINGPATRVEIGNLGPRAQSTQAPALQPPAGAPRPPQEAAALAAAVRVSATRQTGLAPVFSDAAAAAALPALPAAVRAAAAQVLGFRLTPQNGVSADDVKAALARSGVFFEARIAGSPIVTEAVEVDSPARAAPSLVPAFDADTALPASDLKAALTVLRHLLRSFLAQTQPVIPPPDGAGGTMPPPLRPAEGLHADAARAEAQQQTAASRALPPPYRGALPAAQPALADANAQGRSSREIGETLLRETEGALARQTLLQTASLDRADLQTVRAETGSPRWAFEVPLAIPPGTAVAQFEISRDGERRAASAAPAAAWRARFSLDVEPIGPVHAQIALTGARAAVTLWAERGESAERLRADAKALATALREADLDPGDVTVREGAPPRPAERAAAGRFVDRAS